jgi:hypothetical protein
LPFAEWREVDGFGPLRGVSLDLGPGFATWGMGGGDDEGGAGVMAKNWDVIFGSVIFYLTTEDAGV